jgi:hypothetical protein
VHDGKGRWLKEEEEEEEEEEGGKFTYRSKP